MLGYAATWMQQVDNDILVDTEYLVFGFVYSLMLVFYYWLDQDVFLERQQQIKMNCWSVSQIVARVFCNLP